MKYSSSKKKLIFTTKEEKFIEDAKLSAKANSDNPKTNYIGNIVMYLLTGQKVIKWDDEKYTYPENSDWDDYEYLSSHITDGLFLISSEIYHYVSNIENHNDKVYNELVLDIIAYNAYIRAHKDKFYLVNIERCKKLIELAKYSSSDGKTIKNFLTSFTWEQSMDLHLRMNQYGFDLLDTKDRKLLTKIMGDFIELGHFTDKIENFPQYAKAMKVLNISGIEVKINVDGNYFILEGEI